MLCNDCRFYVVTFDTYNALKIIGLLKQNYFKNNKNPYLLRNI